MPLKEHFTERDIDEVAAGVRKVAAHCMAAKKGGRER
jgi:hypothetical protein